MAPTPPQPLRVAARSRLTGAVQVPGDPSIGPCALICAALAIGESRIEGLIDDEDVRVTAAALRAMGAQIERDDDGLWRIHGVGVGGLLQPAHALDMGDGGAAAHLLMGLVASHPITATFVGDAASSGRPMDDVVAPLSQMGTSITASPGGRLPLMIRGLCPAVPIDYTLPAASAQIGSAVLLAGLNTPGITRVIESVVTRDHDAQMLRRFGADLTIEESVGGRIIAIHGEAELTPQTIALPGDPSSAAVWLVAASIVPGSDLVVRNVGLDPTRSGLIAALRLMGADITEVDRRAVGGGFVADLHVRHAALTAIDVPPALVPRMIDDAPLLLVAAAFAKGRTVARGVREGRGADPQRIATMAAALTACGIACEPFEDGLAITGTGGAAIPGGATVAARRDHRIAMGLSVAGLHARRPITIDDVGPVATRYPAFYKTLDTMSEDA